MCIIKIYNVYYIRFIAVISKDLFTKIFIMCVYINMKIFIAASDKFAEDATIKNSTEVFFIRFFLQQFLQQTGVQSAENLASLDTIGPPETPQKSRLYGTEGFKGGPELGSQKEKIRIQNFPVPG